MRDAGRNRKWDQGQPSTLSPAEWMAWAELTGEIVRPEEYQILRAMDEAYVYAVSKELSEQRQREQRSGSS